MLVTAMEPRRKSMVEIYLDGQSAGQVDTRQPFGCVFVRGMR